MTSEPSLGRMTSEPSLGVTSVPLATQTVDIDFTRVSRKQVCTVTMTLLGTTGVTCVGSDIFLVSHIGWLAGMAKVYLQHCYMSRKIDKLLNRQSTDCH